MTKKSSSSTNWYFFLLALALMCAVDKKCSAVDHSVMQRLVENILKC